MLIVGDILAFPIRGLLWVFEEIYNATEQELRGEADGITAELQELYVMLESGQITEAEFDLLEAQLLDRLDEIHESRASIGRSQLLGTGRRCNTNACSSK
jgi:type VI protein secretion system component VasK